MKIPRIIGFAALVAIVAAFPLFAGNYPIKLLQEILIWGIFAMSLDLLMGYAGMVSFGHSAFFGIGGYVAALALVKSSGLVSALLLPALAAAVAALLIGFFSIRVSGVYFIMLTLAFSQMFYAVAFQAAWLGAEDGLVGVPRPSVLGWSLASPAAFHAYLLVIVALCTLFLWRIVRSPFGHVLRGIHDNEGRMEAVGYPVNRYKLLAFVIGGTVAGVAGSLYCQLVGSISPDAFLWTTSGEALLMVIIGQAETFGKVWLPGASMLMIYVVMALILLFRPHGVLGRALK